ncbi:hypothetical protein BC834DRAFT_871681 [Gloeopeniophorella convolvens]|nr:hypothetical protein BC834DRAFT_871681 [Gloeopeniophorella convolvens]
MRPIAVPRRWHQPAAPYYEAAELQRECHRTRDHDPLSLERGDIEGPGSAVCRSRHRAERSRTPLGDKQIGAQAHPIARGECVGFGDGKGDIELTRDPRQRRQVQVRKFNVGGHGSRRDNGDEDRPVENENRAFRHVNLRNTVQKSRWSPSCVERGRKRY